MHTDLLLERTGDAAFACDQDGRVVGWNRAAETLLGHKASDVLGLPCYEAVQIRDVFGHPYWSGASPLRDMLDRSEPFDSIEMEVRTASGESVRALLAIVVVDGEDAGDYTAVHVLLPFGARPARRLRHRNAAPVASLRTDSPQGKSVLTAREHEILELLAEPLRPEQIASQLGISIHTARAHIQHIHGKLSVHSTLEAVVRARRQGLV